MVYESVDIKENETLIKENEYLRRNRDKAIKELKDTSVDMPSTLLIEVIDYVIYILEGGEDNET